MAVQDVQIQPEPTNSVSADTESDTKKERHPDSKGMSLKICCVAKIQNFKIYPNSKLLKTTSTAVYR